MKTHKVVVEGVLSALNEIFFEDLYADKVIEKYLKQNRKWGSRDRKFFAENVYEITRWWRKYWELLGEEPQPSRKLLWQIWAIHWQVLRNDFPAWFEELAPEIDLKQKLPRAIEQSIPDWMDLKGEQELGEKWPRVLAALNEKAPVDLRVNILKLSREDLINKLRSEEIDCEAVPDVSTAVTLKVRQNVFRTESFQKGFFEVQDRASQQVVPLLNIEPGMRIIDACAGAGGKSLHMASLMKNKGKILSLDIHEWKLKELKTRAARAGVDIIETRVIDSTKVTKRLEKSADRLLLDVPCSGMGVLRRNPDSKWKLSLDEIERMIQLQREILSSYHLMLKETGLMVYATCSVLPSENEKQIEWFLKEHPGWTCLQQLSITPDQGRGDGFFAAVLKPGSSI